MKSSLYFAIALTLLLASGIYGQPTLLVDTGAGSASGQAMFGTGNPTCQPQTTCQTYFQYLAGKFTLTTAATLDSVQGYMSVGGNMTMAVKIYTDNNGKPGTSIFSKSYPLGPSFVAAWQVFSNYPAVLSAGTYWLAFEPAAGSSYQAAMPGGAPTPLADYAYWANGNSGYASFGAFGIQAGLGMRISGTVAAAPTYPFGTFTRVIQIDQQNGVPVDNIDFIGGAVGAPLTATQAFSSFGGVQTGRGTYVPISFNGGVTSTTVGPSAGAYSASDQGYGSARGIAFSTFQSAFTVPTLVTVNATLDGQFLQDVFGLPNGTVEAAAAIHVVDFNLFNNTVNAGIGPSVSVGQFLLGGYSSTQANDPGFAVQDLDSILTASRIGGAALPTYVNGPFTGLITAPLSASFTVNPGQTITVIFDVATSTVTEGGGGAPVGAASVDFLNTLKPAANLFTDVNGNPISGFTTMGAAPVLPPAAANLSLAAGASHTASATVTDSTSTPVANAIVKFTVTSGPNTGIFSYGLTNSSGQATFTYADPGGPGTDSIQATLGALASNVVKVIWQATPVITWANPAAITYGTALGLTQLDATANVAGTFVYTPSAGAVLGAGTQTLSVAFTPSDTTDYTSASATVTLVVNKATPVITWANPAAVTYGAALGPAQLDATANVAGTFVYTPAAGTVLGAGTQMLSVAFTPSDTTDYASASATVTLVVNKAMPVVTWATPAAITAGTALGATQLDATASVPGSFIYSPPAGTVLSAGNQPLSVSFTPTDTMHYANGGASVVLVVNPAGKTTPVITWATPAPITYGTPLSKTQLNATANVAGTFTYTPAAGTILAAGSQMLSVTFTPTNTASYSNATASVTLQVNKATPFVLWLPIPIVYGTPLGPLQLDAFAFPEGSFVYTPAAGTKLGAGEQQLSATFTPKDANFAVITLHATLVVLKATPSITWVAPAEITSGTPLSATQLNATANVPGTFVYTPAAGTVLSPGNQDLQVTFTPTDSADYNVAKAEVDLKVKGGH